MGFTDSISVSNNEKYYKVINWDSRDSIVSWYVGVLRIILTQASASNTERVEKRKSKHEVCTSTMSLVFRNGPHQIGSPSDRPSTPDWRWERKWFRGHWTFTRECPTGYITPSEGSIGGTKLAQREVSMLLPFCLRLQAWNKYRPQPIGKNQKSKTPQPEPHFRSGARPVFEKTGIRVDRVREEAELKMH